ncbi:MAG: saccharopine dehydrogenase NADP-binding domain-containing protein [Spirochaetales bacterium]|nr:saccharopine dehydrogenase NADP-binding domain-containing protein [Spirochaetales bacterium]
MKIFCLGGAGRIARESVKDLVDFSDFEKITIGDIDLKVAESIANGFNDPRVDAVCVNIADKATTIEILKEYDIVIDGTTISLNKQSTECIALAGCHGVNLNGFGDEFLFADIFKKNKKIFVPGFGMTPGVTQMMAMKLASELDEVDSVRVSHGAFRPIAFSRSISETTVYEYDPELPGRVVFENGKLIQVPPFARPREINLPEPYGKTTQYIIPHAETHTLSKALKHKNVKLIEVRGTWPAKNMRLIKALYEWGFMNNEKIEINKSEIGIMDCISEYLVSSKVGQTTELYGYSLHVEIEGKKNKQNKRLTAYHTHPKSDVKDWEGLRAYTRNVGIPMSIAAILISKGKTLTDKGMLTPEEAFNPDEVFKELEKRDIKIWYETEEI